LIVLAVTYAAANFIFYLLIHVSDPPEQRWNLPEDVILSLLKFCVM
jgi:hypothetical protein